MISAEVAQYLAEFGHGTYSTTNSTIFLGRLPDQPNDCIAVYEREGNTPDGTPHREHRVQILVRDDSYESGFTRAEAVYNSLMFFHGGPLVSGGTHVVVIRSPQSGPGDIGRDAKNRHEWSINIDLLVAWTPGN